MNGFRKILSGSVGNLGSEFRTMSSRNGTNVSRPARIIATLGMFAFVLAAVVAFAKPKEAVSPGKLSSLRIHFDTDADSTSGASLKLHGKDARQQLLVTAKFDSGALRDFTRQVTYTATPTNIVKVENNGVVTPIADGRASVTASSADGIMATLSVTVEQSRLANPINFPNQIVPIFTKNGCNAGGCHGKSTGQNGFKLSLLGFEPSEDFEHLVKEARGRRLFPASPERSLLLQKGAALVPHGGGQRLNPSSDDYKLLVRWIAQGMPYGRTNDPTIARLEVLPKERTMPLGGEQQLVVLAHYTDGSVQDVTRSALYEPNDKNMAATEEDGRIKLFEQPGDVAVMVRYQAKVAVFRATIPLGAPVDHLPVAQNFVDDLVFLKLKAIGMPPSELSDDATFLRRVTVDIAGRLPTPEELRRFVADTSTSKREMCVDSLLASADYAEYFASKWSSLLRNKRNDAKYTRGNYAFWNWIRDSFAENKPYDQFVRDVIAASGDITDHPAVGWYRQVRDSTAQMEDTAQLFLGTRLQCAQCHHHPYEKWSQQDYYSFSAFFSQVGRKASGTPGEEVIYHRRGNASATNKKTKESVKPAGLGAAAMAIAPDDDPRQALADWLGSRDNPFFARSLVNRYWKHFFNRGLVEPEDDMRETNPATNPELLDALAAGFVKSGYDLKQLIRVITTSRTYQLSAVPNEYNAIDKQNFSRYYPKRLNAEVLLDSVNTVMNSGTSFDRLPAGTRAVALPDNSFNASSYFLTVFGRPESSSSCECERSADASLSQSLHLLNSPDIQTKLVSNSGRAALLANDKRGDDDKLRELYVLAFSRPIEPRELAVAKSHLEKSVKGKEGKDVVLAKRQAYEDILWALINTKEFLFNH